jgi:hypothetical protein
VKKCDLSRVCISFSPLLLFFVILLGFSMSVNDCCCGEVWAIFREFLGYIAIEPVVPLWSNGRGRPIRQQELGELLFPSPSFEVHRPNSLAERLHERFNFCIPLRPQRCGGIMLDSHFGQVSVKFMSLEWWPIV